MKEKVKVRRDAFIKLTDNTEKITHKKYYLTSELRPNQIDAIK